MFVIAGVVATLFFVVFKKGKHKSRISDDDDDELQMSIPIAQPDYQTRLEVRNDRTWLLNHQDDDESDVEEWSPIAKGGGGTSGSAYQRVDMAPVISTRTVRLTL